MRYPAVLTSTEKYPNVRMMKSYLVRSDDPLLTAAKVFDNLDILEATRLDYKIRIKLFLEHIKTEGINTNSFLEFKRYLLGRSDLAISTKNKYLTASKIFLKELNRTGILPIDITHNVKSFAQGKKHKKDGLNSKEVELVIFKLQQLIQSPQSDRIKAIFALLAFQGLRQIEIVRLDVADLDLASRKAFILGKGQDDKIRIDLHPETVKILKEYLKSNKKASGALFTSLSHNSKNIRLSTRTVRGMVKNLLTEIGVDKTTHGFRHFFTTRLCEIFEGNVLEIAKYTRHKSVEMLQVYNDEISSERSLPTYYKAFGGVHF